MPGRSLEALAVPGKFLLNKIAELKKQQQEQSRRKVTERELAHLHHKIDKLLIRLEEHELEPAQSQEEECAICISAKATMQTFPCGHRVVCRKCFVKTIQMAVSQRLLPLRCVICRAKILRLKQLSSGGGGSHSQSMEAMPKPLSNTPPSFASSKVGLLCPSATMKLPPPSGLVIESKRPLPPRINSFRAARRQVTSNRPLIPIPETEELEIVHSVRQVHSSSVYPDFGTEVWAMQKDLNIEPSSKKSKKGKHVKWWSRLCQFHTPSLIKNIRNKCSPAK